MPKISIKLSKTHLSAHLLDTLEHMLAAVWNVRDLLFLTAREYYKFSRAKEENRIKRWRFLSLFLFFTADSKHYFQPDITSFNRSAWGQSSGDAYTTKTNWMAEFSTPSNETQKVSRPCDHFVIVSGLVFSFTWLLKISLGLCWWK